LARRARAWPAAATAGAATAAISLPLFMLTLQPGVGFWDTAEFQTVGPVLGIAHPTGYPTYTLLLWLASVVLQPLGDPALRANLLSALLVAGGCGLLAALVVALGGRWLAGPAAGLSLAFAPAAWALALHADPHALHLALVVVLLALLIGWYERLKAGGRADRWLLAASVVYGVALGNHALTLLLAPGIALFLLVAAPRHFWRRWRLIVGCAAALTLTTAAIYLYLPIRAAMHPPLNYADPQTWDGFRYVVLAEQFRGSLTALPALPDMVSQVLGFTLGQLGPLAVLAPLGLLLAWRRWRPLLVLLLTWWLIGWVFALGYVNADIERYYVVPLAISALFAGLGAAAGVDFVIRAWFRPPALPRFEAAVGWLLVAAVLLAPLAFLVPARYGQVNESGDTLAQQWLAEGLPQLANDAVVISWWSFSTTLWYAQFVEGERPDVLVVDDRTMIDEHLGTAQDVIESYLGQRPVYVIRLSQDLLALEQRYVLTPVISPQWGDGTIYRVDGRVIVGS
jgi:hypothetical protein